MPETLTWVEADGTSTTMNSTTGCRPLRELKGRFASSHRVLEDQIPLLPGTRVRSVVPDARTLTLPVMIANTTESLARATLRLWVERMEPARGAGKLQVTGPGGDTREHIFYVIDGLDIDEAQGLSAGGIYKTALTLHGAWPYWQDTSDTTQSFTGSTPTTFFPIFPVRLSSSAIFGNVVVVVQSDKGLDTWPVWTITGPGGNVALKNVSTGRSLFWAGTLGNGETLTIDTRPPELAPLTNKSVVRNDGTNAFGDLTSFDLWPLFSGSNSVQVEMDGSTGASQVNLRWRNQYQSA